MSSEINNGGPAYPGVIGPPKEFAQGMSLRDFFAAQALTGMLASEANDMQPQYEAGNAAQRAYWLADAMLKAREP